MSKSDEPVTVRVEVLDRPFAVVVTTQYFWGGQMITYREGAASSLKLKYVCVDTSHGVRP